MNHRNILRSLCALILVLVLMAPALPVMADTVYMRVQTGNSGSLNLRTGPGKTYASLGLYPNGTQVTVISVTTNNWAQVIVNGKQGFMDMQFLTGTQPVQTAAPTNPTIPSTTEATIMYVQTGNTGSLHLRQYASQSSRSLGMYVNGTPVLVTSRAGDWAAVTVNGVKGYMMLRFLSANAPAIIVPTSPTTAPSVPSTPSTPSAVPVPKYIHTGNTGRLHLRQYASTGAPSLGLYANGTLVYAVDLGNGWSSVTINGAVGYMMSRYLVDYSYEPQPIDNPTPAPTSGTTKYVYASNGMRVHFRQYASRTSASLGLLDLGTPVTVLLDYGTWSYVRVYGQLGYIMSQYLVGTYSANTVVYPNTPATGSATATVIQPGGSFVNLRSSKDSNANNVIAQVPTGAVVSVLEWGSSWSRVAYAGKVGYMVTHYLH